MTEPSAERRGEEDEEKYGRGEFLRKTGRFFLGLYAATQLPGTAEAQEQAKTVEQKETEPLPSHGLIAFFVSSGSEGEHVKLALNDLRSGDVNDRRQAVTKPFGDDLPDLRAGTAQLTEAKLSFDGQQIVLLVKGEGFFAADMPPKPSRGLTLQPSFTSMSTDQEQDRIDRVAREELTRELSAQGKRGYVVHSWSQDRLLVVRQYQYDEPPGQRHSGYHFYEATREPDQSWDWKPVSPRFSGVFLPESPITWTPAASSLG